MLNPSSNAYYNTVGTGGGVMQNTNSGNNNSLVRKNNTATGQGGVTSKAIDVFKFTSKDTGAASGRVTVGK